MRRTFLIVLAVIIVAAGLLVGVKVWRHTHGGVSSTSIPVSGGVDLSATVITPGGTGRHPLVVMPTSWGSKQNEYFGVGGLLAHHGFVVVAYTQRGFNASGGQVDFAGPTTVADVSTVIDWAIRNASADPNHIGMLGQSYGAGVSLLAAERDPRIKAVVALSTWTEWGPSVVQNGTLTSRTLASLMSGGSSPTRHLDSDITTLALEFSTQPAAAIALIDQLSPARSPMAGIAALDKNHTAVMMANGFQDSLFDPQQLVDFYDKLTSPKRLQLGTGDHGQVEEPGMLSGKAQGPVVGNAVLWLQHYLEGADNGIDRQPPIEVQDATTGAERSLASWPGAGTHPVTLSAPAGAKNYSTTAGTWTAYVAAGHDSLAASPYEDLDLVAPYRFTTVDLTGINPLAGLRWDEPAVSSPLVVQGTPSLSVSVTSTAPTSTFFAYLYDVKPSGQGTLISVTPDTVTGLSRTSPTSVTLSLVPMAWTVPAGDHVSLVIDTVDTRWTTQAAVGTALGIGSPSTLTLPTP